MGFIRGDLECFAGNRHWSNTCIRRVLYTPSSFYTDYGGSSLSETCTEPTKLNGVIPKPSLTLKLQILDIRRIRLLESVVCRMENMSVAVVVLRVQIFQTQRLSSVCEM